MAKARCEICDNYYDESEIDWDTMLCTNCFIESLDEVDED